MTRAREEQGSVLIMTIIILFVVMGIGAAILTTASSQQRSAAIQQSSEAAYSLAEAALNAQVYQLSLQWPTSHDAPNGGYQSSCSAASAGASYCPTASDLSTYSVGSQACPTGTPGDAWSSSSASNGWTTYVRDAGGSGSASQSLFTSATEKTAAAYDSSASNAVWVRAVATVNCRTAVVISKVSAQLVPLTAFPQNVLTANGFETSNNGNKVLLNTQGSASQASGVSVRCNGIGGGKGAGTTCTSYRAGQVSPDTVSTTPSSPSPTLTASQLAGLKAEAIANGTYWAANSCPSTISQLTGAPTYIEGPCTLSFSGSDSANASGSPGYMVLVNGTLDVSGSSSFYGVVYAVNAQGSSGDVVTIHGNGHIYGAVDVDANGTVQIGSSHESLTYDASGFSVMKTYGGAAPTPNSFRQLPVGQ